MKLSGSGIAAVLWVANWHVMVGLNSWIPNTASLASIIEWLFSLLNVLLISEYSSWGYGAIRDHKCREANFQRLSVGSMIGDTGLIVAREQRPSNWSCFQLFVLVSCILMTWVVLCLNLQLLLVNTRSIYKYGREKEWDTELQWNLHSGHRNNSDFKKGIMAY